MKLFHFAMFMLLMLLLFVLPVCAEKYRMRMYDIAAATDDAQRDAKKNAYFSGYAAAGAGSLLFIAVPVYFANAHDTSESLMQTISGVGVLSFSCFWGYLLLATPPRSPQSGYIREKLRLPLPLREIPTRAWLGKSATYVQTYARVYEKHVKRRQLDAAVYGCGLSFGLLLLYLQVK